VIECLVDHREKDRDFGYIHTARILTYLESSRPPLDKYLEIKYLEIKVNNVMKIEWTGRKPRGSGRYAKRVPEDSSGVHLWLVLWKTARALERRAQESIEALEMCQSDFGVLEALLNKGPLAVNQIGRKVLLTSGSITTAIDRLEHKGLVERGDAPDARRVRMVNLTSRGRKLIQKAFADHAADMQRLADVLDLHERAALIRLLKKLGLAAEGGL